MTPQRWSRTWWALSAAAIAVSFAGSLLPAALVGLADLILLANLVYGIILVSHFAIGKLRARRAGHLTETARAVGHLVVDVDHLIETTIDGDRAHATGQGWIRPGTPIVIEVLFGRQLHMVVYQVDSDQATGKSRWHAEDAASYWAARRMDAS